MKKTLEFKVGTFVLGGLVLLVAGIFLTKDLSLFKRHYRVNVEFDFAEGLKKASPVQFSGVAVGEIQEVKIMHGEKGYTVMVTARIQNDTKIPVDSKFFINSLGVLSEKYLEILPGEKNHFLQNGQMVTGISPIPLRNITENANLIINQMQDFLGDVEFKDAFHEFVLDLRESTSRLKELLSGKGTQDLIQNLSQTSQQLNILLNDVRSQQGTLGKLLYDPGLYDELEGLAADLRRNPWKLMHKVKEKKVKPAAAPR